MPDLCPHETHPPPTLDEDPTDVPFDERRALAYIFAQTQWPTSPAQRWACDRRWPKSQHILTNYSVCYWYGVECGPSDANNVTNVVSLNLTGNCVSGYIELSLLSQLSRLEHADFAWNAIIGFYDYYGSEFPDSLLTLDFTLNRLSHIVPSISALHLKELHFVYAAGIGLHTGVYDLPNLFVPELNLFSGANGGFKGTLPEMWGDNENLTTIDLHANFLVGTIPESWVVMENLQSLKLSGNQLSGDLPDVVWSASLKSFQVSRNQLVGTIPEGVSPLLETFAASDNRLEGVIPRHIASNEMRQLLLSNNRFEGELPLLNPHMEVLDISSSVLQAGPVSPTLFTCCVNWTGIYLPNAGLTGTIRWAEVATLCKLKSLVLDGNDLDGEGELPLDNELWSDTLQILSISNMRISGHLRPFFQLRQLRTLRLSNCDMSGTLPEPIDDNITLEGLTWFQIDANHFTGTVPVSYPNVMGKLEHLSMANNELVGAVPEFVNMNALANVYLNNNHFNSSLLDVALLCNSSAASVGTLDLSGNRLAGSICGQSSAPFSTVKLSGNLLSGDVSDYMYYLTRDTVSQRVQAFDISNNRISGTIPPITRSFAYSLGVRTLAMARNRISGTIPWLLMSSNRMDSLDLSHNAFTSIELCPPLVTQQQTPMSILSLSHNNISMSVGFGKVFEVATKDH